MDKLCNNCWNKDCKKNEKIRNEKIDVCRYLSENPEELSNSAKSFDYDFWDDRTLSREE